MGYLILSLFRQGPTITPVAFSHAAQLETIKTSELETSFVTSPSTRLQYYVCRTAQSRFRNEISGNRNASELATTLILEPAMAALAQTGLNRQ